MIRIPNKPSKFKKFIFTVKYYWRQITILLSMVLILSLFFPRGKTLLYSYQINDIAREEVVAPFNFPILKTEEKLREDLNEAIKSEPYLFIRSQDVVNSQINALNDYFELIKLIQSATNKLKESRNELYRNRFSDQYNIARVGVQSDSVDLSILNTRILNEFSFAAENDKWKSIFETSPNDPARIDLDSFKEEITQIARNRWAEGIYDISLSEILSDEVAVEYDGDQVQIGFNVTYLMDALRTLNEETVEVRMSDGNSGCLLQSPEDESTQYLIMPMRL